MSPELPLARQEPIGMSHTKQTRSYRSFGWPVCQRRQWEAFWNWLPRQETNLHALDCGDALFYIVTLGAEEETWDVPRSKAG